MLDYSNSKFVLVPLKQGTKKPDFKKLPYSEWGNLKTTPPLDHGQVGLLHINSGTCALDIDDYSLTKTRFTELGLDLDKLCATNVGINSGRENRYKLIMKLKTPLPTKKIVIDKVTAYELRCTTQEGITMKDVVPPSINPESLKNYTWVGDYNNLQECPPELIKHWQDLTAPTETTSKNHNIETNWKEIEEALTFIDPDCPREEWLNIAMSIHHADYLVADKKGWDVFNEWSKQGEKYTNERETKYTWNSIKVKENGIKIATLFSMAFENGYIQNYEKHFTSTNTNAKPPEERILTSPIDIMNMLRPPPPSIDLDLLPEIVKIISEETSVDKGSDPLVTILACLSVACGAVDSRTRLKLNDGDWEVPPVLWMMTIGNPASKKSPASRPVFKILKELETEDRARFARDYMLWEGKQCSYDAHKKDYLDACKDPLADMINSAQPPVELESAPVPLRITVSDITSQKLVRHCADRPRGVLCHLDEMAGWVTKIADSRSGEDRSSWVSAFESEQYELDRVSTGSTYCENLAVSIYGNIQPQVLRRAMKNLDSDGLLQRFIPVVLRDEYNKVGQPVSKALSALPLWDIKIRELFNLEQTKYTLSEEAHKEFRTFQYWFEEFKRDEAMMAQSSTFMTALGKIGNVVGRLTLVFHLLEDHKTLEVKKDTITRVIKLVKDFIIPSMRYVFSEVMGEADNSVAVWLTNYLVQHSSMHTSVSLRDIKQSAKRLLAKNNISNILQQDTIIKNEMYQFEKFGWVVITDEDIRTTRWVINSQLSEKFKDYREKLILMKQKQLDQLQKTSKKRRFVTGYEDAMEFIPSTSKNQ